MALAAMGISAHGELCDSKRSYTKFQYAGLAKNSPSHAQQKRTAKKAKKRGK